MISNKFNKKSSLPPIKAPEYNGSETPVEIVTSEADMRTLAREDDADAIIKMGDEEMSNVTLVENVSDINSKLTALNVLLQNRLVKLGPGGGRDELEITGGRAGTASILSNAIHPTDGTEGEPGATQTGNNPHY